MTIDREIEGLIEVASRLIDLMDREINVLRAMRPADLEGMQQEKADLTAAYEQWYATLEGNREAMALLSPALRGEFEAVAKRFDDVVAENTRALMAAKVAHERLIGAVVEAVKADRRKGSYSSAGAMGGAADNATAEPVSLSLDCRL